MKMENEFDILKKLWKANEDLLKKLDEKFTHHFELILQQQLDEWEKIVSTSFHLALNRFKAIQYLTNPGSGQSFFIEAASLTRSQWENWLTLAWLDHADPDERKKRIIIFKNNSIISQVKINEGLKPFSASEATDYDKGLSDQAKQIKENSSKDEWEIPGPINQLKDISKRDERFRNCIPLYYNTVYKDLSQYVHPSWRTIVEISGKLTENGISTIPHPSLKKKCASTSGGFLIYTAEIWNKAFKVIPENLLEEWHDGWTKIQRECRNLPVL